MSESFSLVKTRAFPTIADVRNPYIFGKVKSVINVSEKEDAIVKELYAQLGICYHHFPTKEETYDMNWENIKAATKILLQNINNNIPTIVHCIGGNNRSPMIVECAYYALNGIHLENEYKKQKNHLIYNSKYLGKSLSQIEQELEAITNSLRGQLHLL